MKHHNIKVTKRCTYEGKKGRCKNMTTITHPYCAKHTKKVMGLSVKKSKIKGAGLGLFAERTFKKGEEICKYEGEILTIDEYDERYADDDMGAYGITLNDKQIVDAALTSSGLGRYACDYHGSGKKNNAEYQSDDDEIWIVAIKKIKKGDEIYTDYGEDMHEALGL